MIRRLSILSIILLLIALLGAIPHGSALAVPRCGTGHTVCTPTPTAAPVATPTPHPTTTPGAGMANPSVTAVTPFQATGAAGATIAPSLSGLTVGNTLVMLVANNQGTALVATPSGWAAVPNASNLQNPSGTTSDRGISAFTKTVGSTTETASLTTTGKYSVVMFEVTNTSGVTASSGSNTAVTTAGANPTLNTGAGVAINDLIVSFVATMTTGNTFGAGAGYTALPSSAPASTNVSWRAETKTATGGGAQAAAFTNATTTLWSEIAFSLAPPAVPAAPGTPTGALGANGNDVVVTWTDNAANGAAITDHHVSVYDAPSGGSLLQTIDTGSATTSSTVTGLAGNTAYYIEVTASNSAGESAHSARSAGITPSHIILRQAVQFVTPDSTSATVTSPSFTPVAGDTLVVIVATGGWDVLTVTDTAGNVWRQGPQTSDSNNDIAIWSARASSGVALTVTASINPLASAWMNIQVLDYYSQSSATSLVPDAQGSGNSTASPLTVNTTGSTSAAEEVVIAGYQEANLNQPTTPTGYTQQLANAGGGYVYGAYDKRVFATGVQSLTVTTSGTPGVTQQDVVLLTLMQVPDPFPLAYPDPLRTLANAVYRM